LHLEISFFAPSYFPDADALSFLSCQNYMQLACQIESIQGIEGVVAPLEGLVFRLSFRATILLRIAFPGEKRMLEK